MFGARTGCGVGGRGGVGLDDVFEGLELRREGSEEAVAARGGPRGGCGGVEGGGGGGGGGEAARLGQGQGQRQGVGHRRGHGAAPAWVRAWAIEGSSLCGGIGLCGVNRELGGGGSGCYVDALWLGGGRVWLVPAR